MISRSLAASGFAALLVITLATPAQAAQAPLAACTVPTMSATLDQASDDSVATMRGREVSTEVDAVFGATRAKERIADQLRRGLIGTALDSRTGQATVVATPEFGATRKLATAHVITGCHSGASLINADNVLTSRSWHADATKASFTYSLWASDSRFHISFDQRYPEAAGALSDRLGDRAVVALGLTARSGRLNDGEPHFGGAGIQEDPGSMYTNDCTSGFTVRRNANGERGAITAGHCYDNGSYINSGPQFYGYTFGRVHFPDYDIIGIRHSVETYDNVIHTDPCCPSQRDVIGYDPAVIGDQICMSGMVSRAICGIYVTSVNSYFCDVLGCTGGLIEGMKSGQVIVRSGDSGAPMYTRYGSSKALAVGMLVGSAANGTIAYGEHIGVVETYLNVSLLTS